MLKAIERNSNSDALRVNCHGLVSLDAKLEPWMIQALEEQLLSEAMRVHGSPVNILNPALIHRNVLELQGVAERFGLKFRPYFARKANKCLAFVDQAKQLRIGIDTASEVELIQCLEQGVAARDLICTAAIKSDSLLSRCISNEICIAVDNDDELEAISTIANQLNKNAVIAIRIGGFKHAGTKLRTRFGFDVERDRSLIETLASRPVIVQGLHFHLDGYNADHRVSALGQAIKWIQRLRAVGHEPCFIDMGGGFPVCYLESERQWNEFWKQHELAILGQRDSLTYRDHGLGRLMTSDGIVETKQNYPYWQSETQVSWLHRILNAPIGSSSVAVRLQELDIELRCEPGRSLMNGCGLTVAQVEFRKQNVDGDWLIGLAMNGTQCRTSSDDFLVDPLVIRAHHNPGEEMEGFLVGAYCTESDLLSQRKLCFPHGIQRGDFVAFPNTAGYFMHFLESRSHQFPLARNLLFDETNEALHVDDGDHAER